MMLPSRSRVKLNRAALSDAAEHKAPPAAAPRRRRLQTLVKCTADPPKPEFHCPGKTSASEPGGFTPDTRLLTHHQTGPGNGACVREMSCSRARDKNCTRKLKSEEKHSTGSRGFLSKAAQPSSRHLPLECECPSPQRETSMKKIVWDVSLEGSPAACGKREKNTEMGTSKTAIEINRYPKVNLCNVAESCDSCVCRCGYTLPRALRTKSVHCFKKDMKAGFRFLPECFRYKKHVTNNETLAKKHGLGTLTRTGCNGGGDDEQCSRTRSVLMRADIHKEERLQDRSGTVGERRDPTRVWDNLESSEHESGIETDDPDSFTCQRVKAYLRQMPFSCARAYMSWPFVNRLSGPERGLAQNGGNSKAAERPFPHSLCRQTDSVHSNASRENNGERCDAGTSRQSRTEMDPRGLSSSSLSLNGRASTVSTPSLSAASVAPSRWETTPTLSPVSSPFSRGSSSGLPTAPSSLPPPSVQPDPTQGVPSRAGGTLCGSVSSTPQYADSCSSSIIPKQHKRKSDGELSEDRSLPKPPPFACIITAASSEEGSFSGVPDECTSESPSKKTSFPPVRSPVSSPKTLLRRRSWRQSSGHAEAGTDEVAPRDNETPHSRHESQISCDNPRSFKDYFVGDGEDAERVSSFRSGTGSTQEEARTSASSDGKVGSSSEEERGDETDFEDDAAQGPADPETKTSLSSGALTDPPSSPSSDGGSAADEPSPCSDGDGSSSPSSEGDQTRAAGSSQPGFLDEITAYEQDILLVDVIQDDPELFDNLPQQALLNLGPPAFTQADEKKPAAGMDEQQPKAAKTPVAREQRWTQISTGLSSNTCDTTDESRRPWRPQYGVAHTKHPGPDKQSQSAVTGQQITFTAQPDAFNNHVNGILARSQTPVQTAGSTLNMLPHLSVGAGPLIKNSENLTGFWRPTSNAYCRHYFSESQACGFKNCRFRHLPAEGDEKFCIEIVARFAQNPTCLQKAGEVFAGYYQSNPPGPYFSQPVLLKLLWALLEAGMVSDVLCVLKVSSVHNITPSHEFLLALFNHVRENCLAVFVPELLQLTCRMSSSGLDPTLNCLHDVKEAPVSERIAPLTSSDSSSHKLVSCVAFPKDLNLAIVEMELRIKQEDWRQLAVAYISICQSSQHPNQVERISGRVAIALLSESKDKLSLPFAAFAKAACQNQSEHDSIRSYVGRIGVSLMLRYHKTHQWVKGRTVVETLSLWNVDYSTLKGLLGNEDGVSRCRLITVATELFLTSGSVEGALNTLRENQWFLCSCSWPCEPADLERRTQVLHCLAEKTSHRDKLEVLCNLPGIKEPNGLLDVSKYSQLFNAHLQACVDRKMFPVAVDTVDFMLSKKLLVGGALLKVVLNKLGRQNHWLRAREVFRRALSLGYYPEVSAPTGVMALTVPCRLGEVELVLAFEMFVTFNAASILHHPETYTLAITLKRTQSSESEYLSAGSRLLSAASIPQPKLIVHYNAVNSSHEQVFTLDSASARRWLRSNHAWAREVWKP